MALTLATTQSEVTTSSTALYAYWQMPVSPIVFNYYQGSATPADFAQFVVFRDIIGTSAGSGYSQFRYRTWVQPDGQYDSFVFFTGALATSGSFVSYSNGLSGDHNFSFQNINILAVGAYSVTVKHEIWAKNSNNSDIKIDEHSFTIKLNVFSSTAPEVTPGDGITYNWTLGRTTPLAGTAITIRGASWSIDSPFGFYFAAATGVTVTNPTSWGGGNATGTGTKNIVLAMMPGAVPNEITENPLHLTMTVNAGLIQVPITVIFREENGLFLSANTLLFEAAKGIYEADAQTVTVDYTGDYYFESPPWVFIDQPAANNTAQIQVIPLPSINLDAGTYTGTISIKDNSGVVIGSINVTYIVSDAVLLPYTGPYCFTLDNLFTRVHSSISGAYFKIVLRSRIYGFNGSGYTDRDPISFSLPLFNGRQKINIGAIVHQLMERMTSLDTHYASPYIPAEVWLDVTEHRGSETEVYNLGPLHFVAGLTPDMVSNCGFMDINPLPRRSTPSGYQIVNMIIGTNCLARVVKNGEEIAQWPLQAGIRSEILDFAQLGAAPGDVFSFALRITDTGDNISKRYIIFPEGYTSLTVIWEDEYRLRQVMEFTGKYKLKNTFEHTQQELERDGVPFLDKIKTAKTGKFTLNTGWILKTDKASVESLCRATNALLITPTGNIRVQPIPGELAMIDIDETTVSVDVDFQINRNYDEEIHLF